MNKARLIRRLCWLPALALALHGPLAHAGLIGADRAAEATSQDEAAADRAKVQQFLDRATVKERLQALGVDALSAQERVKSLGDAEVHALAQRIDAMPAGGALSQNDWILILLLAILLVLLI